MSREHGDAVEWIDCGMFRVLGKRHGKTERGKVGIGKDIRVIGIGVHGAITCPDAVVAGVKKHGITEVLLQRTPEACRTYSALIREGKAAALLAHGTC
jgi:hypothetical protein